MINNNTKEIAEKINKIFTKASENAPDFFGARISSNESVLIGTESEEHVSTSTVFIAKCEKGVYIYGHAFGANVAYTNISNLEIDQSIPKHLAINAKNPNNIKLYFLDKTDLNLEIKNDTDLQDADIALFYTETKSEVVYLIASKNPFSGGTSISLTSTNNEYSRNFLRHNFYRVLHLVSKEAYEQVKTHFEDEI